VLHEYVREGRRKAEERGKDQRGDEKLRCQDKRK
jgi:hypothetical protein